MSKDKNITGLTSLRFNSQNGVSVSGNKIDNTDSSSQTRGLALPQVLNNDQRDAIVNSDNINAPILFGTTVYNINSGLPEIAIKDKVGKVTWTSIGAGVNIEGNSSNNGIVIFDGNNTNKIKDSKITIDRVLNISEDEIETIAAGHIVTFTENGNAKIKDSGVAVSRVPNAANQANATNQDRYLMSNFGAIEFINGDGSVLLDSLSAFTLHTQGAGAAARVCTVFSGDLPAGSSSPSAVLELNTSEGVLLLSRLTNAEENALDTLKSGSIWYNSETNKFRANENGINIDFGGGAGIGDITVVTDNNFSPAEQTKLSHVSGLNFINNQSIYTKQSNPNQIFFEGDPIITCLYSGLSMKTVANDAGCDINIPGGIGGESSIVLKDMQGSLTLTKPYTSSPQNLLFRFPEVNGIDGQILTWRSSKTEWSNIGSKYAFRELSGDVGYTANFADSIFSCNTTSGEVRIDLLYITSASNKGHVLTIKDTYGHCADSAKRIKIIGSTIDGNSGYTIDTNYGHITLCCYGTGWSVISK